MKLRFKTDELEYFYLTPLDNLAGKLPFQKEIITQFKKKIQLLISVDSVDELRLFKSLHFETLKGNLTGEYSIRLNIQYRLIFSIEKEDSGDIVIEVILINEISKHYEK
jgi:plasmid maintenance system killer protein